MPMRLLVTGSRNWTDEQTIQRALMAAWFELDRPSDMVLVTGACPTGADRIAEELWRRQGFPVERHPADWDAHGRAAGPLRNQRMVDLGADLVLAFPAGASRGTRHCIKAAQDAGLEVRIYEGNA